jgi:AcrR family transcriptional regulator
MATSVSSAATSSTPRRVLDAALGILGERGASGISMGALSARSGVSNGSIYHHFGSKEGVIGALILEAMQDYQHGIFALLEKFAGDAEQGVRHAVSHHLHWHQHHRAQALVLLQHRGRGEAQPWEQAAHERNRTFTERSGEWLDRQINAGLIPFVSLEAAHAIVYAPADEICRIWLQRRIDTPPTSLADVLGTAAWHGLLGPMSDHARGSTPSP